jgi:hypothetical protein
MRRGKTRTLNVHAAQELFAKLDAPAQLRLLARFGHELTIVARDTYDAGTDDVLEPQRLRRINEIQHRVFDHITKLLAGDTERYPDQVLISVFLDHDDATLRAHAGSAFQRATRHVAVGT